MCPTKLGGHLQNHILLKITNPELKRDLDVWSGDRPWLFGQLFEWLASQVVHTRSMKERRKRNNIASASREFRDPIMYFNKVQYVNFQIGFLSETYTNIYKHTHTKYCLLYTTWLIKYWENVLGDDTVKLNWQSVISCPDYRDWCKLRCFKKSLSWLAGFLNVWYGFFLMQHLIEIYIYVYIHVSYII